MNKPRIFVHLTEEQRQRLEELRRTSGTFRVRQRAFAILLSDQGYCVDEIANILGAHRDTVSGWIDAWQEHGEAGLYDKPRSGAPPTLTAQEQARALKLLEMYPRQPKKVLALLEEETGKTICRRTLARLARREKMKWKRTRGSSKPYRDDNDEEFRQAKQDIGEFQWKDAQGECDLYYFDETGFSCKPTISYAWQKVGETLEIPSKRSSRLNVLGFFSLGHDFFAHTQKGPVDSQNVVDTFDEFSLHLDRPTIVVIDQASMHTSKLFRSSMPRWEERGLYIYDLPTYSPELNKIEIHWRMVKHQWLPLWAYKSFTDLKQAVHSVLQGIGDEFFINFSEPAAPQAA